MLDVIWMFFKGAEIEFSCNIPGGIGWYLKRNVLQIETTRVSAILVSIIVLVLVSEAVSAWARARVAKAK